MNTCNHPIMLVLLLTPFKKSFSAENGHLITMAIRESSVLGISAREGRIRAQTGKGCPKVPPWEGPRAPPRAEMAFASVPKPKKAVAPCDSVSHPQHESVQLPGLWFCWEWALVGCPAAARARWGPGQGRRGHGSRSSGEKPLFQPRHRAQISPARATLLRISSCSRGTGNGGDAPLVSRLFLFGLGSLPAHNRSLIASFSPVNLGVYQPEPCLYQISALLGR